MRAIFLIASRARITWASGLFDQKFSLKKHSGRRAGNRKPDTENVGASRCPLPDRAMRERMVRHMESIPAFAEIGNTPWYPGKRYPGIIGRAQAEMRART
jgi:hypothetical protein